MTQPTGLQSSPVNFHGNGLPSFVRKVRKVTLLPEKRFLYTNRALESRHHIYKLVSEAFLAERKGAFRKRGKSVLETSVFQWNSEIYYPKAYIYVLKIIMYGFY